jgi:hypothetical protein
MPLKNPCPFSFFFVLRRALEIDPDSASPAANLARLLCNKDANSPSENRNESMQSLVESKRLVRAALENRPDDPVRVQGLYFDRCAFSSSRSGLIHEIIRKNCQRFDRLVVYACIYEWNLESCRVKSSSPSWKFDLI